MKSFSDMKSTRSTSTMSKTTSPLVQAMIFYILILVFVWVILYTFQPSMVCQKDAAGTVLTNEQGEASVDKGKCFVAALLLSLLFILAVWVSKNFYGQKSS